MICVSYEAFLREKNDVVQMLFEMTQSSRSVLELEVKFCTTTVDSGWNASTLYNSFYHGLATEFKDELTTCELPSELD